MVNVVRTIWVTVRGMTVPMSIIVRAVPMIIGTMPVCYRCHVFLS